MINYDLLMTVVLILFMGVIAFVAIFIYTLNRKEK